MAELLLLAFAHRSAGLASTDREKLRSRREEPTMPQHQPGPFALSSAHLLVLEDEAIILMDLVETLKQLGCGRVTGVTDVNSGLRAIAADDVDVALLDLHLNGDTCLPVADELSARGIPFVFASGSNTDELPERFKGAPFLVKPYDYATLGTTLIEALTAQTPPREPHSSGTQETQPA